MQIGVGWGDGVEMGWNGVGGWSGDGMEWGGGMEGWDGGVGLTAPLCIRSTLSTVNLLPSCPLFWCAVNFNTFHFENKFF